MTFYKFLEITQQLEKIMLLGFMSVILAIATVYYIDANAGPICGIAGVIVSGLFLFRTREEYKLYKGLNWPVVEIYEALKSNRDKIQVLEGSAIYESDSGEKIVYSRCVPGSIVEPDPACFTLAEREIIESAFRETVIAHDNSQEKERQKDAEQEIRDQERAEFASILKINKDSNDQENKL